MSLIQSLAPVSDYYRSTGTSSIEGSVHAYPNLWQNMLLDDDSKWIYSLNNNNSGAVAFGMSTLAVGSSFNSLTINIRARADSGNTHGTSYVRAFLMINDVFYMAPSQGTTVYYADYIFDFTKNPATGLSWTLAEINSAKVGVEWGVDGFQSGDATVVGTVSYLAVDVGYASTSTNPPTPIPPPGEPTTPVNPETLAQRVQRWVGTYTQEHDTDPDPGGVFYFLSDGTKTELTPPAGVTGIDGKTSFCKNLKGTHRRLYMNGGHTDNIAILENDEVVKINIPAPPVLTLGTIAGTEVKVEAATGPGLTGTAVVYIRFIDSTTARRGPLSNGVTIALVDQLLKFTSTADIVCTDTSVDKVEVLVALAGDYPRSYDEYVLAGSTTHTTTGDVLGAADIDPIAPFPICTLNTIYHDMLVLAGDADEPQRVYLSLPGELECWAGKAYDTKNGDRVIGLFVVRDTLIVQTASSHDYIQGYSASDIQMGTLSPSIGGLGHHTVVTTDDLAFFPSHSGWFYTDGSSLTPIGVKSFNETWAREQHWTLFTDSRFGWSMHDSENRLIKYKTPSGSKFSPRAGLVSANGDGILWVLDYTGLVTGTGGVELFFDTCAGSPYTEPTASAMMRDTNGEVRLYTAHASGDIALDNVFGLNDLTHAPEYVIHFPQVEIASPGDDADCAAVVKLWLYMMNEDVDIEWTMFAGNSYDWQAQPILGRTGGRVVTGSIAAAAESISNAVRVYRDRVMIHPEKSAGSTVSVMLKKPASSASSEHEAFAGSPLRADGTKFLAPTFSVRGWGISYKSFGEETRSIRPYATP